MLHADRMHFWPYGLNFDNESSKENDVRHVKMVAAMRKEGISVLLVEQNVRAAVEIADRAYVIDDGKVVYEGGAAEFARDEQRVRALAGASADKWEAIG